MMDAQLAMHTKALRDAQTAQIHRLGELYPLGSQLSFTIMRDQKNPSTGTVWAYEPNAYGGTVRVKHDQAKPRGRYRFRRVYVESIIGVEVSA